MTDRQKTIIQSDIYTEGLGTPCPCCLEINEAFLGTIDDQEFSNTVSLFQKVFGVEVAGDESTIAFRIMPIPRAVEKRGEDFFWQKQNMKLAHNEDCKRRYQAMWLKHPKRVEFLELLEASRAGLHRGVVHGKGGKL